MSAFGSTIELSSSERIRLDRSEPEVAHGTGSAQVRARCAARTLGSVAAGASALAREDRLAADRVSSQAAGTAAVPDRRGARRHADHRAQERRRPTSACGFENLCCGIDVPGIPF